MSSSMADKQKIKRTYMVHSDEDGWLDNKAENWPVDKSFLVRRAVYYYMARGQYRDKKLRKKLLEAGINPPQKEE